MIGEKHKSVVIVNPHFNPEQTQMPVTFESAKNAELRGQSNIPLFNGVSERVPKGYGESTKKFDMVQMKLGLRK